MRLPLVARGIGALLVGLLGTYAVLFVLSTSTQSTLDRLSTVNISDQVVESYPAPNTRGAGRTSDSQGPTQLYLDALSTLRGARKSTLGLFPEYESDSLRKVESQLKQLLDQLEKDAFLALEAQFYLGKVSLAQGELSQARPYFRTVVAEDGRRAEEAKKILKTLREDYPVGGDDAR